MQLRMLLLTITKNKDVTHTRGNQPEIVSHILCAIYSFNLSKRELSFEQGDIKDSMNIFVRK